MGSYRNCLECAIDGGNSEIVQYILEKNPELIEDFQDDPFDSLRNSFECESINFENVEKIKNILLPILEQKASLWKKTVEEEFIKMKDKLKEDVKSQSYLEAVSLRFEEIHQNWVALVDHVQIILP